MATRYATIMLVRKKILKEEFNLDLIFDRGYLASLFPSEGYQRIEHITKMAEERDRLFDDDQKLFPAPVDLLKKLLGVEQDETLLTLFTFAAINRCGEESWRSLLTKAFPDLKWDGSALTRSIQLAKEIMPKRSQPFLKYQAKDHPVKYLREVSQYEEELEGKSLFDAVISINGINIFTVCKFTSDISYETTFVTNRNQIARSIDAGLDSMDDDVDHFYFLLITPKRFQEFPGSRLYYFKMREYQSNPIALALDIPRIVAWLELEKKKESLQHLNNHIGWLTWEEMAEVILNCDEITPEEKKKLESFYRDRMLIDD